MKALTMTRVLGDVDTVAMMGYSQAANRNEFIRDYCNDTYGYHHVLLHKLVGSAFKEAANVFGVDAGPRRDRSNGRRAVQMADIY